MGPGWGLRCGRWGGGGWSRHPWADLESAPGLPAHAAGCAGSLSGSSVKQGEGPPWRRSLLLAAPAGPRGDAPSLQARIIVMCPRPPSGDRRRVWAEQGHRAVGTSLVCWPLLVTEPSGPVSCVSDEGHSPVMAAWSHIVMLGSEKRGGEQSPQDSRYARGWLRSPCQHVPRERLGQYGPPHMCPTGGMATGPDGLDHTLRLRGKPLVPAASVGPW